MRIARRKVLLSLLGVSAIPVLGLKPALAMAPDSAPAARLARALAALVPHPRSARAIGNAYLALKPEEADVGRLIALLCPNLHDQAPGADGTSAGSRSGGMPIPPHPQLRRLLAERRRADFCEGQIVRLNGWIVPATEARLCALLALGAPAKAMA